MTEEEFERLKEAEKEHLRSKKRFQARLRALKKQKRTENLVQKMKDGAQRLLRETESLVDTIQAQIARSQAEFEETVDGPDATDDLSDADTELREERAETLVQQYKAASGRVSARTESTGTKKKAEEGGSDRRGPDKTIGRMRSPASDESAEETE